MKMTHPGHQTYEDITNHTWEEFEGLQVEKNINEIQTMFGNTISPIIEELPSLPTVHGFAL